jgi:hypothetical protein
VLFDVLYYIQAGLKFVGATGELLPLHMSTSQIFITKDLDIGFWGSMDMKLTTQLPTSAEVKNTWIYISTSTYFFMA